MERAGKVIGRVEEEVLQKIVRAEVVLKNGVAHCVVIGKAGKWNYWCYLDVKVSLIGQEVEELAIVDLKPF